MGDRNRILVPQLARVFLAPVGTPSPDGPTAVLDAAWIEVGFFTPDSLQWSTDPKFEEVRSHQSNFPTRRFQTEDAATLEVDLQEWSEFNFRAVYGGGTVVTVTPTGGGTPYYKFSPPAIGARTQTAAIIEIIDGTKNYRRIIPRCEQTEGVELKFDKGSETVLPLRLSVIGSDIGDPWFDESDDPSLAPA